MEAFTGGSWCRCASTPVGPSGSPPTCPTVLPPCPPSSTAPNANVAWPSRTRTAWKGLLRGFDVTDDDTGVTHRLRVAYIWSSGEAASVADACQPALLAHLDIPLP